MNPAPVGRFISRLGRSAVRSQRSVLLTGGANGLGEAISRRLAQEGYNVAICDIDMKGEKVAQDLQGMFLLADVSKPDEVKAAVAETVQTHGTLDAMVINAGVVGEQKPLGDYSLEEWQRVIDVNLNGVFYSMKYSLQQMAQQPTGGSIVCMSSTAGKRGLCNLSPYTAAKWGICGLTEQAAVEYSEKNIRVNAVAPTAVDTPLIRGHIESSPDPSATQEVVVSMNALPGMPQTSDVADAVAFLLSDNARYITGHTLPVDGGALCRMANSRERWNVK